jgi:hypothetical protein
MAVSGQGGSFLESMGGSLLASAKAFIIRERVAGETMSLGRTKATF